MEILGNFVVFEGGDGSGTSTQLALLRQKLADFHPKCPAFFITAEPTDGPIGRIIRNALKKDLTLRFDTLALLYAADRGEHLYTENGIIERCTHGELVVSDRYVLSSLAYQGISCGEELPRSLNSSFPAPELVLFFYIDPRIAQERMNARSSQELFDAIEFQKKVRERYHILLAEYRDAGVRVAIINAADSVEQVAEEVWRQVSKMPIMM